MWKEYSKEIPEFNRLVLIASRQFGLSLFVSLTRLLNIDKDGHHFSGVSNPNWRPELWMYVPEIPEEMLDK